MTTGQRIAQKRKELGLSQEALGDRLGVTRQSIYKWESDSALPEIEKLVALSRLFGVSIGWLLGWKNLRRHPLEKTLQTAALPFPAAHIPMKRAPVIRPPADRRS